MELDLSVNRMPVHAVYADENVKEIFLPLLRKLDELEKRKNGRVLVMVAAPPAAGKSSLTQALAEMARLIPGMEPPAVIGMDGYHRYQSYLDTHTMLRDGREICMASVKGCPETFDLEKLKQKIAEVAAGGDCSWPDFDRMKEDPVEDAFRVTSRIVLLEGNYLLLDREGWRDLAAYADMTVSITAELDFLRARLLDRKMKAGTPREQAIRFVDASDMYNVRTCLEHTLPADLQLYLDRSGLYSVLRQEPADLV